MTQPGRLAAPLAAALCGLLLGALSLTWRIDQSLYDGTMSLWSRPVADDIAIIAIDDASLTAIGRWPWPRAVHATLLDQLAVARPRAIALDLLLSEPDPDPRADALLADAMRRAAPVVLPTYFFAVPTRAPQPLLPAGPLATAAAQLSHMDAETDADGVLRHAWLRAGLTTDDGSALQPHLAVALLQVAGDRVHPSIAGLRAPAPQADAALAWRRDERVLIRYAGAPGTVPTVSYVDVLRGTVPASAFAGKRVLIGATAAGLGDLHPTPVSGRRGPMAGVEITAQLVDALRGGHAMRAVPPLAVGGLAAALALLLFAAYGRRSAGRALQITGATVLLLPVASALLMGAGWWLPPTALLLTTLLAYPLWSWQRLAQAQRLVDNELTRWPGAPAARRDEELEARLDRLRRAGDEVRQSRRLLADGLAALPEAVLVTDAAGTVQIANERAARLAGAPDAAALCGRPLAAVLADATPLESPDWPALMAQAQAANQARVTRARSGTSAQDAGAVDLLARLAPFGPAFGDAAGARGLVVSLADVTRLTAAERSRDELLALVSHDLRAPQASLVAMVELARFGRLRLAPTELLDQVERLAQSTLSIADEFLQIGSVDTRRLQFVPLDLAQPVRAAVDELRLQSQVRDIRLALQLPAAPLRVRGDAALLRRACINLLTNALRATSDGGSIEIEVDARDGAAALSVRDHGPGIAAEVRERLFHRYERSGDADHRPALLQGIGLGLALVDSVARRHGGSVVVDSQPGQGACFTLRLPLADSLADRLPDTQRAA